MDYNVLAIGENVILVSNPPKKGDEQKTAGGLILPPLEQSGLPDYCEIYAVGELVPDYINVGDLTAVPKGNMNHVPHPDVMSGKIKSEDNRESLITCNWRALPAIYTKK